MLQAQPVACKVFWLRTLLLPGLQGMGNVWAPGLQHAVTELSLEYVEVSD